MKSFKIMLMHVVLITICNGCSVIPTPNLEVTSGFNYSKAYQAVPIRPQLQFELIQTRYGNFGIGPELVADTVIKPKIGGLVGASALIRYAYSFDETTLFITGGAGPTYLNIYTNAQGSAGFNFIDQIGGGVDYRINDILSLEAEYRFSHISNAGLRKTNAGINTQGGLLGLKFNF